MTLRASVAVTRGSFALEASLEVAPGEVLAVVGPNGAGKSTLLDAIAGLAPLTTGTVEIDGGMVTTPTATVPLPVRRIGLLGQDPMLFPHLSALENVAFGRRARGEHRDVARSDAARRLALVGLSGLEARRPTALSGGQQQRVALARALAAEPQVLLLDEPFAAIDVASAVALRSELRQYLTAANIPVLVVTHDVRDVVALADTVLRLEHGRVVAQGAVDDMLNIEGGPLADPGYVTVTADEAGLVQLDLGLAPGERVRLHRVELRDVPHTPSS